MGTYRVVLSKISISFIFNIIITNKNKIAIAPTYTIKNKIGKNSIPNINNKIDKLKKDKTKDKTECMGFVVLITVQPDIIPPRAKIKNKHSIILMSEGS